MLFRSRARYAEFVTTKDAITTDGSQLTHALALVTGYAPPAVVPELQNALRDESLLVPEMYMQHFVFRALADAGCYDTIRERLRRYWEPMTEGAGSPTIWEANVYEHGKTALGESGSLCHGFACTPIETMQALILGVTPLADGYKTFRVAPQPLGCTFASGTIPTPHGTIAVSWTEQGAVGKSPQLLLHLTVPDGCTAIVPSCGTDNHYAGGDHSIHIADVSS